MLRTNLLTTSAHWRIELHYCKIFISYSCNDSYNNDSYSHDDNDDEYLL